MLAGLSCSTQKSVAQLRARVMPSAAGGTAFLPERWGCIQVAFVNLDEQPAELLASSFFEEDPTWQFGRRTWVPGRSRLTLTHPVRIPALKAGSTSCSIRTVLVDPSKKDEVLVRGNSGGLQEEVRLLVSDIPSTAIVNVPEDFIVEGNVHDLAYQLAVYAKASEHLGRRLTQLNDSILPATPEAYAGLDQLIVADTRLSDDRPALAAMRSWLYGGGHLWIMLDRVDPEVLEVLIGDEWTGEVVDRVELTSFTIEPTNRLQGPKPFQQEKKAPASMTPVMLSDVEIASTINGWPAAFWKQCGHGKLLVTTLSPEGWMQHLLTSEINNSGNPSNSGRGGPGRGRPGSGGASSPAGSLEGSSHPPSDAQQAALLDSLKSRTYVVIPPMRDLAAEFFSPRTPPFVAPVILESHVREYVGNSVPSRWLISGLLAGFSVLLAALGGALWRTHRLEWLGAAGPALAIAVSLILMLLGLVQRRSIPPTVASVQFVEPARGTDGIRVSGITDTYAPDADQTILASAGGGWMLPDRTGQQGQTTRLVWTDMNVWEWEHLPPTSGQRLAEFATTKSTDLLIQAKATFDSAGLTGKLNIAGLTNPADGVVATQIGRLGTDLKSDGSFRASQVFSGEQFIAADLLSDEQNRRSRTVAAVLSSSPRSDFPHEPTLLVWTDPLDLQFRFDDGHRKLGAALVAVPLILERPVVGSEVRIPSPFLPYRAVMGPDGVAVSGLYDFRRREWQDRSLPSSAWLRFQIPSVLLPLEPLRANVSVQVAGPVGKLEITALRGTDPIPVKTWTDPVGTLSVEITDPALLQVTEGGLLLKIAGGDSSRPTLTQSTGKANYWRIESLRLELTGKTALIKEPR